MKVTKLGTSPMPKFEPFSLQLDFETVDDVVAYMVAIDRTRCDVRSEMRRNPRVRRLVAYNSVEINTNPLYYALSEEVNRLLS